MKNNETIVLLVFLIFAVASSFFIPKIFIQENFENQYTLETPGLLPESNNPGILDCVFPETGYTTVQDIGASQIWREYPIFQVGCYTQTTNNIRYPDNPDEGTCMPAEFCNLYYKDRPKVSNIVMPLPPVAENESGTRVNYFYTPGQLMPFNNPGNILY
jgi:hypothetical protein